MPMPKCRAPSCLLLLVPLLVSCTIASTPESVAPAEFHVKAPQAKRVLLADVTGRGHFAVTLSLKPGRYAYMFVVDGATWMTDPRAEAYRDDGFGNKNALVNVEVPTVADGDT